MQTFAKGDWQTVMNIYSLFNKEYGGDKKRFEKEEEYARFYEKESDGIPAGTIVNFHKHIIMYELDKPRILSDTFEVRFILRFNLEPDIVQSEVLMADKGIKVFNKYGAFINLKQLSNGDRVKMFHSMMDKGKNGSESKKEVHAQ